MARVNSRAKPIELHVVEGTKQGGKIKSTLIPDQLKARVPYAEWLENPEEWNRRRFIKETSDFLFDTYGIGCNQDKHTLAMLATHMEMFARCQKELQGQDFVIAQNDGKTFSANPLISIQNNAFNLAIKAMNELGLTPRARLSSTKPINANAFDEFLKGP